jgi:hypothetical protein
MKKTIFFSFIFCVLISLGFSAQDFEFRGTKGVLLDNTVSCNDYFFWCSSFSKKIYECHGYEYGCGYDNRAAYGSVHVVGGYAYFGWESDAPGYDRAGLCIRYIAISLSTWSGPGSYQYVYESGGVLTSHGGSNTYNLSFGPDPGSRSPVNPDDAKQ